MTRINADRLGDDAWTVGFFICGSWRMKTVEGLKGVCLS